MSINILRHDFNSVRSLDVSLHEEPGTISYVLPLLEFLEGIGRVIDGRNIWFEKLQALVIVGLPVAERFGENSETWSPDVDSLFGKVLLLSGISLEELAG